MDYSALIVNLSKDVSINLDLTAVVQSTLIAFDKLCPDSPPAGIRPIIVYSDNKKGPLVDSTSDISAYHILLTVEDRYYNQVVYQLAHELCHIFADPRRSNWFTECCCELASLVMLDRIAEVWKSTPPFNNWKELAPTFKEYGRGHIQEMIKAVFKDGQIPDKKELQKWLEQVGISLKSNPNDRPRNTIIALMLRHIIEESSSNWSIVNFLGRASTNPPTTLTDLDVNAEFSFKKLEKAVPDEYKVVAMRIESLFLKAII